VKRGGLRIGLVAIFSLGLVSCGTVAEPAPSPPTIQAVGVATDVRIYPDHTRYVFADGTVHEVPPEYRQLGDGAGFGLVVIGSDEDGPFVLTFPLQADLPPDCYRENGVGIERGDHIELWGVLFAKAPGFSSPVLPTLGAEYPAGTRFCLNDRGLVTSVIGADVPDAISFEAWTFSSDLGSIEVDFYGAPELDLQNPCSKAYRGVARIAGDELAIGIFPEPFPGEVPDDLVCTGEGHRRSLEIELPAPFGGWRIRDLSGQVFFLKEPPGLVEIAALPDGWVQHDGESLSGSPTGRWSRTYTPAGGMPQPGSSVGQLQLIQAFGAPADVTGGDRQPDVTVNGEPAAFYLWPPAGEMVLVWTVGDDGVALVGNLADFSQEAFVALAESVTEAR
jgi:hypothetical protein